VGWRIAGLRPATERDRDPQTQAPVALEVFVFVDHCVARPRVARSASPRRVTAIRVSRQRVAVILRSSSFSSFLRCELRCLRHLPAARNTPTLST
jgi:hypothetical protein